MEGYPIDDLMTISLKSEPTFHVGDFEIEDVHKPEVKNESDPLQMESTEVTYGLTTGPVWMEVTGSHSQDSGPSETHAEEKSCDYKGDYPSQSSTNVVKTLADVEGSACYFDCKGSRVKDLVQHTLSTEPKTAAVLLVQGQNPVTTSSKNERERIAEECGLTDAAVVQDVVMSGIEQSKGPSRSGSSGVGDCLPTGQFQLQLSGKRDEPSGHHIELNEVRGEPSSDPSQLLNVSEIGGQDCGSCLNMEPKIIHVEDKTIAYSVVRDSITDVKDKRRDHMSFHTGKRLFACDLCDYTARRKTTLAAHRMTHTGERPFACDSCDYATIYKRDLATHRMIHTGERPFACDLCDYCTIYKRDLATHRMSHLRQRPFACEVCDYSTAYKRDLAIHRLIHTGERPFACEVCDYTARAKSTLTKHLRRTHKRDATLKDPLHIESNAAQGEATDVLSNIQLNRVQHVSPSHPSKEVIEVFSSNDGSSKSSILRKVLTDDIAMPGPSGGPLKFGEQDKSANGPSTSILHRFTDEPDTLHLGLGGEHTQDTDPSRSCEPASAASSNVEFKARKARDLKPADVMSHSRNEPSKCSSYSFGLSEKLDEPSHHPSQIELNEIKCEPQNDPLRLEVSELNIRNYGAPVNEDNSMTCGIRGCRTDHKYLLMEHVTLHTEEKPFACDVCDYTTRKKFNLVRHMKVHTRAKTSQDPSKAELNVVSCASQCGGSIEVCSKNGSSESFKTEEIVTKDIAMPGFGEEPSNDPLQTDRCDELREPSSERDSRSSETVCM